MIPLTVILLLLLLGGLPAWNYSKDWGFGPAGLIIMILILVLIFAPGRLGF